MSAFYTGLAEILEVEPGQITPQFELQAGNAPWDSLAMVSAIALIDDCFSQMVPGRALATCTTVGDIERLIAQGRQA